MDEGAIRNSAVQRRRTSMLAPSLGQALRAADDILELLPVATCICDPTGRIVQYNRRATEIWGRAPQPGQTHDEFTAACRFFTGDGQPLRQSRLSEVLKTGQAVRDEEVLVERADGTQVAILLNIDPLTDSAGRLIGAINCFQDVTDRKQVYEALNQSRQDLRRQQERWASTYEHAAIGIVESDAEGRFLRINESICTITGLTREQLLGWRLFSRTHPDDRDMDEELYRRQVAGDIGFYSIEKRFVRPDGRTIWCSIRSSTVRDDDGKFLYGVRVVQDITERKEAEQRQKLLVDELNHRVKNTLATVQSLAAQTLHGADSIDAFRRAFEGRLIALSQAHDQLTRRHWRSAARTDDERGQIRRAVDSERAGRNPMDGAARERSSAGSVHRMARVRRAFGPGAEAPRFWFAIRRRQHQDRAARQRAIAFRARRLALRDSNSTEGRGARFV
jgi:PAS domain S-box-containing protein